MYDNSDSENYQISLGAGSTRRAALAAGLCGLAFSNNLMGQSKGANLSPVAEPYFLRGFLPDYLERYVDAIGPQLRLAGKERLESTGTLTVAGDNQRVASIYELPGRYRVEFGSTIVLGALNGITGANVSRELPVQLEDSIESLILDRPESAFYNVRFGAAIRVLGYQVRTRKDISRKYAGPYYDVFDIEAKGDARAGSPTRKKRYLFDSFSGLLQRVLYRTPATGKVTVATHFSGWTKTAEGILPTVIERRVNGEVRLKYVASAQNLKSKQTDGIFDPR